MNDPRGWTNNPASSDHYSYLKMVLFCVYWRMTWVNIVITTGRDRVRPRGSKTDHYPRYWCCVRWGLVISPGDLCSTLSGVGILRSLAGPPRSTARPPEPSWHKLGGEQTRMTQITRPMIGLTSSCQPGTRLKTRLDEGHPKKDTKWERPGPGRPFFLSSLVRTSGLDYFGSQLLLRQQ